MSKNYIAAALILGGLFICGKVLPIFIGEFFRDKTLKGQIQGGAEVTLGVFAPKNTTNIMTEIKLASSTKEASNILGERVKQVEAYLKNLKDVKYKIGSISVNSSVLKIKEKYARQYFGSQNIEVSAPTKTQLKDIRNKVREFDFVGSGSIYSDLDNKEKYKKIARNKAIEYAKENAKTIAKDVGANLDKVISFNDNPNWRGTDYPKHLIYIDKDGNEKKVEVMPEDVVEIFYTVTIAYATK